MLAVLVPYPHWLNPGDNAWQLTAATLVGMMSLPGIAVLYAGIVKRKWAVNTMLMAFAGFASVLVVWVLWAYQMGFGHPLQPLARGAQPVHRLCRDRSCRICTRRGRPPSRSFSHSMPALHFPTSSMVYFQFVFAAITPLLFLGSVLGGDELQGLVRLRSRLDHLWPTPSTPC